jgi:hypothetical protein
MDGLDQDDPATGKRGVEHRTSNIERPTSNIEVEEFEQEAAQFNT